MHDFIWALVAMEGLAAVRRHNWRRYLYRLNGIYIEVWPSGFTRIYQPLAEDMSANDWEPV